MPFGASAVINHGPTIVVTFNLARAMASPLHKSARFNIGQVVNHRRFGYRGVIFDVDPHFMLSEEWYRQVALSRPPRHQPWYHLLVDGERHTTYVAERHLLCAPDPTPINHPMLNEYFDGFNGAYYERRGFIA